MEEVDKDKDGFISFKEFHEAMKKVLEADYEDLLIAQKVGSAFAKKLVGKK